MRGWKIALALSFLASAAAVAEEDFDGFWAKRREEARALPLNASYETPREESGVTVVELGYDGTKGVRLHGYLGIPAGGGRRPGLVMIPGLGDRGRPERVIEGARRGFLSLSCDLRGQGQSKGSPPDVVAMYMFSNPESHFVVGCVTDVLRGIDLLAQRPEWDGNWLFVEGFSLGGGLTIATTALDSRVDAAAIGAPAFCDFQREAREGRDLRMTALRGYLSSMPDPEEGYRSLGAVDNNNFAARLRVPVIFGMNKQDPTIAYAGVRRAYEQVPIEDKAFIDGDGPGHTIPPGFFDGAESLFRRVMGQTGM